MNLSTSHPLSLCDDVDVCVGGWALHVYTGKEKGGEKQPSPCLEIFVGNVVKELYICWYQLIKQNMYSNTHSMFEVHLIHSLFR